MVHADTVEFHGYIVERESIVFVEVEVAVAVLCIVCIDYGIAIENFGCNGVEIGIGCAPEIRFVDLESLISHFGGIGFDRNGIAGCANGLGCAFFVDVLTNSYGFGFFGFVDQCGFDVCINVAVLLLFEFGGSYLSTEKVNMNVFHNGQFDIASDTASGIPSRRRNLMIYANGDHVFTVFVDVVGQIIGERCIAVGMIAEFMTVDVNGAVHVHAIEIEADAFVFEFVGKCEALAIPCSAAGFVGTFALEARIVSLRYGVVMRHSDVFPFGIVKKSLFRTGNVAQMEAPVRIEVDASLFAVDEVYCIFSNLCFKLSVSRFFFNGCVFAFRHYTQRIGRHGGNKHCSAQQRAAQSVTCFSFSHCRYPFEIKCSCLHLFIRMPDFRQKCRKT